MARFSPHLPHSGVRLYPPARRGVGEAGEEGLNLGVKLAEALAVEVKGAEQLAVDVELNGFCRWPGALVLADISLRDRTAALREKQKRRLLPTNVRF
jgi:hypothetical protein